jgi:hypothetical protein
MSKFAEELLCWCVCLVLVISPFDDDFREDSLHMVFFGIVLDSMIEKPSLVCGCVRATLAYRKYHH